MLIKYSLRTYSNHYASVTVVTEMTVIKREPDDLRLFPFWFELINRFNSCIILNKWYQTKIGRSKSGSIIRINKISSRRRLLAVDVPGKGNLVILTASRSEIQFIGV